MSCIQANRINIQFTLRRGKSASMTSASITSMMSGGSTMTVSAKRPRSRPTSRSRRATVSSSFSASSSAICRRAALIQGWNQHVLVIFRIRRSALIQRCSTRLRHHRLRLERSRKNWSCSGLDCWTLHHRWRLERNRKTWSGLVLHHRGHGCRHPNWKQRRHHHVHLHLSQKWRHVHRLLHHHRQKDKERTMLPSLIWARKLLQQLVCYFLVQQCATMLCNNTEKFWLPQWLPINFPCMKFKIETLA